MVDRERLQRRRNAICTSSLGVFISIFVFILVLLLILILDLYGEVAEEEECNVYFLDA